MSEEYKITAGTISGATFKSIDIEPSIIVDGKSYTASEFNKAVEMLKQPQLNENQQKYLKQLQYNRERLGNTHDALFFGLVDYEKRWNLNDEDFAQVLQVFIQWVQEQEGLQ